MIKAVGLLSILFWVHPLLSQQNRPNIIYIMADDLGYADLSCYGRKDYKTPNIDQLASQGMKFTNAYAAAPYCTPTRVAFMTGKHPARLAVGLKEPLTTRKKDSAHGLSPGDGSIAQMLKEVGYKTALVGKWHLGMVPEFSPNANGFDYFFGFHAGGADYISHKAEGSRTHDLYENERPVNVRGYLTDLFTAKAIDYLRQKHESPFFLSLHFNAPHWPWQGPGDPPYPDSLRYIEGGSVEVFAVMMKHLDDAVRQIMAVLDEQGLSRNTIVIFTSDNGGEKFSDMGGLSKMKGTVWEGGIRVPAFVRWPGRIDAGVSTDQPVITMDWSCTILAAAGLKVGKPMDGVDLMPFLRGSEKKFHRTFFWRLFQRANQHAIREGNWKYVKDEQGEYLFDLSQDPEEKNNLKQTHKEMFEKLKSRFASWESTVLKPIPL